MAEVKKTPSQLRREKDKERIIKLYTMNKDQFASVGMLFADIAQRIPCGTSKVRYTLQEAGLI